MRAVLVALALMLTACAETLGPSYYLLESSADAPATQGREIGLREIALPLYARRPQIAVLGADGAITLSDNHRWAEDPPRAASRLLARGISATLGRPVVNEPWSSGVAPNFYVTVDVDYLIGALDGEIRLEGQFRAVNAADSRALLTRSFTIREKVAQPTYGALVAAQSRALHSLAAQIGTDLRGVTR